MACSNYNKFNSLITKNIEGYFEVSELKFRILDAQIIFYKNYKKVKTVDIIWNSEDTYKIKYDDFEIHILFSMCHNSIAMSVSKGMGDTFKKLFWLERVV